jgi:cytosine/adenosine deaminase-related metal-dependent hydrolase
LNAQNQIVIRGARYATGPTETARASIEISGDRVARISMIPTALPETLLESADLDLSGWLVLPGFVNAHDHLHFSLFPRMGNPPYRNYVEWGDDIHSRYPYAGAQARAVPKRVRLWWGGIRNLLCGVTTVCHHDPLWPELLRKDFPVRVVSQYGWGHSLALGGDLRQARAATPQGRAFIVHACEGVDTMSRGELSGLDRQGILDSDTVIVHGLALDHQGVALMRERGASVIACPSSNKFLFDKLPDLTLLSEIEFVALGSDSPLTAEGDLLDEVRFAIHFCGISPSAAYRMVTTTPAAILRLEDAQGSIQESGLADLIAVRDTGQDSADRMRTLSMNDIELVMIGGSVQLASEAIWKRLPFSAKHGLEPISVDGRISWLRAPVRTLLGEAEEVLGMGEVRLGGKELSIPQTVEAFNGC